MAELDHFAVLDITQTPIPEGIRIVITTNNPCHLTCYWTDKKPQKHPISRVVRGVRVPWYTYFCFVAWHPVEQIEPGDTFIHTFDLTEWQYCQIRWLTFRGTVGGFESPSVGPIFKKHKTFGDFARFEYYDADFNTGVYTTATVKQAQTFTPQTSHLISQVVLLLRRSGLPGVMNIAIESTDPRGYPNDVILTSGTFDGNALPVGPPPAAAWITIPIDLYQLQAGITYAIVVYGGDDDNKIGWNAKTFNPYPRGRACYWRPAPWFWYPSLHWDLLFEEWGYQI